MSEDRSIGAPHSRLIAAVEAIQAAYTSRDKFPVFELWAELDAARLAACSSAVSEKPAPHLESVLLEKLRIAVHQELGDLPSETYPKIVAAMIEGDSYFLRANRVKFEASSPNRNERLIDQLASAIGVCHENSPYAQTDEIESLVAQLRNGERN